MEASHVAVLQCGEELMPASRGHHAVLWFEWASVHAEGGQLHALLHTVLHRAVLGMLSFSCI